MPLLAPLQRVCVWRHTPGQRPQGHCRRQYCQAGVRHVRPGICRYQQPSVQRCQWGEGGQGAVQRQKARCHAIAACTHWPVGMGITPDSFRARHLSHHRKVVVDGYYKSAMDLRVPGNAQVSAPCLRHVVLQGGTFGRPAEARPGQQQPYPQAVQQAPAHCAVAARVVQLTAPCAFAPVQVSLTGNTCKNAEDETDVCVLVRCRGATCPQSSQVALCTRLPAH